MVLGAVALAFLSAFAGSLLTPGYRAVNFVARELRSAPPKPSTRERDHSLVYVDDARAADFWSARPAIFPASVRYLRAHFNELDPRRLHRYRESQFKLWIPELVSSSPIFSGLRVEVVGEVAAANVLFPLRQMRVQWVVQLRPITTEGALVYCRITLPARQPPQVGQIVTATRIVLVAGGIPLARGGFANGTYMAATAMRRPRGWLGRLARYAERHPRKLARFRRALRDGEL